ncbi:hypothetical protein pb186bvf_012207 [Paramecium bursaria]
MQFKIQDNCFQSDKKGLIQLQQNYCKKMMSLLEDQQHLQQINHQYLNQINNQIQGPIDELKYKLKLPEYEDVPLHVTITAIDRLMGIDTHKDYIGLFLAEKQRHHLQKEAAFQPIQLGELEYKQSSSYMKQQAKDIILEWGKGEMNNQELGKLFQFLESRNKQ